MVQSKQRRLPPMFGGFKDGSIEWKRIQGIDHELLGYFLTCHLLIEHYMDEFLKASYPQLDWEKSKMTFAQRANLLSSEVLVNDERYDPIPAIKHMNSLRNKISHQLKISLDAEALLPISQYLAKMTPQSKGHIPTDPKELLESFVGVCCATFASHLSALPYPRKA